MTENLGFGGGYNPYNGGCYPSGFGYGNLNNNDTLLRNHIDKVYAMYDISRTGYVEGNTFEYAFRELCGMYGLIPPNFLELRQIAMAADTNYDGRISKMEMFNLFKRIQ